MLDVVGQNFGWESRQKVGSPPLSFLPFLFCRNKALLKEPRRRPLTPQRLFLQGTSSRRLPRHLI